MATTFTKYTHAHKCFCDGTIDWDTDTIKVALVTSSYTFSAAHTIFDNGADDATDPSFNEVATGDGYTTGGETLTASASNTALDAVDVTWSALTKTFRGGIVYKSGTANGLVNPLVGYILFDDTPADIVVSGIDFVLVWNASGLFSL